MAMPNNVRLSAAGRWGLLFGLALLLTGCINDLLEFDAGDRVDASTLDGPESAALLVRSAVGDFECAFGQYIVTTGQVSDELDNANLISAEAFQLDRRDLNKERTHYALFGCGSTEALLMPIQTARFDADNVLSKLNGWTDGQVDPNDPSTRTKMIGTAAAFSGYSYLLLGESFCSAAVDGGPELSQETILGLAETQFTRAIEAASTAGDAAMLNLARVGRARARLDLGKAADALADAEQVTAGFEYFATMSGASPRARNPIFQFNVAGTSLTVGPAYLGLTFAGVPDPRVLVDDTGDTGVDNITPLRVQRKYTTVDQSIRMASATEASLIIAEVAGGQRAVDIINALHDRVGLPHFSSTDPAAIQAQVVEERSRELFLESQRFYDIKRLNLPLVPPPGTSYGSKGGVYGDMRCFPLPDVERDNNPNI
jgi:hypothetical protein